MSSNPAPTTLRHRNDPDYYPATARVVGVVFLAGMVVYLVGNAVLVEPILAAPDRLSAVSVSSLPLAIGAVLMLMAAVGDTLHAILMLPVLRRQNERLAFGYFGARIIDAVLIALGIVFLLVQIPLGREYLNSAAAESVSLQALSTLSIEAHQYSYEIGMIAVGFAGLMLCSVLYRAKLVPQLVAVWGLIGYAVLLSGSVLTVMGFHLSLIHTIPGGLWELFTGVWLIAKGFRTPPAAAEPTASSPTPAETPPLVASTTP
jgi:hypothetical protein